MKHTTKQSPAILLIKDKTFSCFVEWGLWRKVS